MSNMQIDYSDLDNSVKQSRKTRSEIDGYIKEINNKVIGKIGQLTGSDTNGYASTAAEKAVNKIRALENKKSSLNTFENSLNSFISYAKDKDKAVSNSMESIAGLYVEKRSWFQAAGDFVYNLFCVDLANSLDWTRSFFDTAKKIAGKIGDFFEPVVRFFKYGDGRYILNIATSVAKIAGAILATVAAIVAIPATGGASTPASIAVIVGTVGAIATGVASLITTVNSITSITQNVKAYQMVKGKDDKDKPIGAAYYYGTIGKLSDYWKKYDLGGKAKNAAFAVAGKIVDGVKVLADVTSFVCSIISLGFVKDFRYADPSQHVKERLDFSFKNVFKNLRYEMGFNVTNWHVQDGKHLLNPVESLFAIKDYKKAIKILPEVVVRPLQVIKAIDNNYNLIKDVDKMIDYFNGKMGSISYDTVSDVTQTISEILSHSNLPSGLNKYIGKLFKNLGGIKELVTE